MKAVVTVIGKDTVGIIAKVSAECAKYSVNIIDITQSVLREYFAMIMLVDINTMNTSFSDFSDKLAEMGRAESLDVRVMHEDIFNAMHKI